MPSTPGGNYLIQANSPSVDTQVMDQLERDLMKLQLMLRELGHIVAEPVVNPLWGDLKEPDGTG